MVWRGVVGRNGRCVRVYRGSWGGDKSTDPGMLMGDKVYEGVNWREGLLDGKDTEEGIRRKDEI